MGRRFAGSMKSTHGWSCPITYTQSFNRVPNLPTSCGGSKGEPVAWPTRFWAALVSPSGKTSLSTTGCVPVTNFTDLIDYVENNAVKAGLVEVKGQWRWSIATRSV